MQNILVLDLDGTVLDIKQKYCKVFSKITNQSDIKSEIFWNRKRSMESSFSIANSLIDTLEMSSSDFYTEWICEVEKLEFLALDVPYFGVINKLRNLRRDYYLILCTKRRNTENLYFQLAKLGLLEEFDKIMTLNHSDNKINKVLFEIYPRIDMTFISDTPGDFETNNPSNLVKKFGVCSGLTNENAWKAFGEVSVISCLTDFPN